VSSATSQSKAKAIRDLLNIQSFDLNWTLPSLRDRGVRRRLLTYSRECFEVLDREEALERAIFPTAEVVTALLHVVLSHRDAGL
jgi:hypothetical protein